MKKTRFPKLPESDGDWLVPLIWRMLETMVDEAYAIRERNSRYFTLRQTVLGEEDWQKVIKEFDDFLHSQQFGMILDCFNISEDHEISQFRNRYLCIAYGAEAATEFDQEGIAETSTTGELSYA